MEQQVTTTASLHRCRDQLKQLQWRAADIGTVLRNLSRELAERGTAPSEESLDLISQLRSDFEELQHSICRNGASRTPSGLNGSTEPVLTRLQEELESQTLVQATLDRLQQFPMIRHVEQSDFEPWQRCLADGVQLRNHLLSVPATQARHQAEQFLAPQTPLNAIFTLVAEGSRLSDESWSELLDAVSVGYGREISTAIARGKLVMTSGTQT